MSVEITGFNSHNITLSPGMYCAMRDELELLAVRAPEYALEVTGSQQSPKMILRRVEDHREAVRVEFSHDSMFLLFALDAHSLLVSAVQQVVHSYAGRYGKCVIQEELLKPN